MKDQLLMNKFPAPRNTKHTYRNKICERVHEKLKDNLLLILTIGGVCLGFGLGFGLRRQELSDSGQMWLGG